jgi:hypothetical protein
MISSTESVGEYMALWEFQTVVEEPPPFNGPYPELVGGRKPTVEVDRPGENARGAAETGNDVSTRGGPWPFIPMGTLYGPDESATL